MRVLQNKDNGDKAVTKGRSRSSALCYEGAVPGPRSKLVWDVELMLEVIAGLQEVAEGRVTKVLMSPTFFNEVEELCPEGEVAGDLGLAICLRCPSIKGYWCVFVTDMGEVFEERPVNHHRWRLARRSREKRRELWE